MPALTMSLTAASTRARIRCMGGALRRQWSSSMSSDLPTAPEDESALRNLACRQASPPLHRHPRVAPLRLLIEIDTDRLTVALVRFICSPYATGQGSCWRAPLTSAEGVLGPEHGPSFLARAAAVVVALGRERCRAYQFLPPAYELASPDEHALLSLLPAACQPGTASLRARAAASPATTRQHRPSPPWHWPARRLRCLRSPTAAGHHLAHADTRHPEHLDTIDPGPPAVAKPRLH
jgi:hypothetical protein